MATILPFVFFIPWLPVLSMQVKAFLPLLLERLQLNTKGIVNPLIFWMCFSVSSIVWLILVLWRLFSDSKFSLLECYKKAVTFVRPFAFFVVILWVVFFSIFYSFFASTNPFVRYLLFFQPLVYIILTAVLDKKKISIFIFALFSLTLLIINAVNIDRFDWKNAVDYTLGFYGENTIYAFDKAGTSYDIFEYYAKSSVSDIKSHMLRLRVQSVEIENGKRVDKYAYYPLENLDNEKTYVLVLSKLKGESSLYESHLKTMYELAESKDFKDIQIRVFMPKSDY